MNPALAKSQRMRMALVVIGVMFFLLGVGLLRDGYHRSRGKVGGASAPHSGLAWAWHGTEATPVLASAEPREATLEVERSVPTEASAGANATDGAATMLLPSVGTSLASGGRATAIGVVDLERLLAAYQATVDPQTSESNVLHAVKRLIAAQAATRGLDLVIDGSAQPVTRVPFVLATNGVPDLTEEILAKLQP